MSSSDKPASKAPIYDNLRSFINIIDELRDVGLQEHINLPRIAVVGTQSAGKSSLLEAIVGIDFLPRGDGVVTRRPLEMRLVHVNASEIGFKPYAFFPGEDETPLYDFQKVHDKIVQLTDKVCGEQKGIVDDPIKLKVFSQTSPDLTLIDLPGITRIAIPGQPKNIEQVTKDMCRRYAKDPRTIILCVIPANQDMSTSDAIQMAQEEDPDGIRTVGVITKIDIMDKGTDARKMLNNQEIPLKLGYVGVKGRSQYEIKNKVKVAEALKAEKDWFSSHPAYSTLPPGSCGTEALSSKLSKIMFNHIRATLPEIAREIQEKIKECRQKLDQLGDPLPSTLNEKTQLVWGMITDFISNYKNAIQGKYDPKRIRTKDDDISGGARIKSMFNELYDFLDGVQPTSHIADDQIKRAIILHQGDSIPGFPSVDSFYYLLNPLLKQLREPAFSLLQDVHLYLENLSQELINKIFKRLPSLIPDITDMVLGSLREEKDIAKALLENIINAEHSFVFTNDLDYMQKRTSFIPQDSEDDKQKQDKTAKKINPDDLFVKEMRTRIDSYFKIVVRTIKDTVPKILGHFLVKASQDNLDYSLYSQINKNEKLLETVGEPAHITAERKTLRKVLDTLEKAKRTLQRDPNLAPTFETREEKQLKSFAPQTKSYKDSKYSNMSGKTTTTTSNLKQQSQQPQTYSNTARNTSNNSNDVFGSNQQQSSARSQPSYDTHSNGNGNLNPQKTQSQPQGQSQDMSAQDVKDAMNFYKDNKEDVHKAAKFANEHKEEIKKGAKFAADHKEDVKKGATFANSLFGGPAKKPSSGTGLFG